jgi:hypothetical protein
LRLSSSWTTKTVSRLWLLECGRSLRVLTDRSPADPRASRGTHSSRASAEAEAHVRAYDSVFKDRGSLGGFEVGPSIVVPTRTLSTWGSPIFSRDSRSGLPHAQLHRLSHRFPYGTARNRWTCPRRGGTPSRRWAAKTTRRAQAVNEFVSDVTMGA